MIGFVLLINLYHHMLTNLARRVAQFATEVQKSTAKTGASSSTITQYRDGQLVNRSSITLKKQ